MIGEAIRRLLETEVDITFRYCRDPTQALKQAQEISPTVILQDLVMPDVDGLLLVRFLRAKNSFTRDIPLIVLSSKDDAQIKAQAFANGANDYLVKLPDRAELLARIRYHSQAYINLLKRKEAEDRLKEENLRLSAEVEITRRLQQMILPKPEELKQIESLDIAGFMEPASDVGGDYYDVLYDRGRVKIGMGDVTGHGLESGVVMIMVQTAIRTLMTYEEADPIRFLAAINRTIFDNVQRINSDKNLTLCLLDYQNQTIRLSTDGITEAENEQGELYGLEQLCQIVSQSWHLCAQEINQAVICDVKQHIDQQTVYDDITLLVIKQK